MKKIMIIYLVFMLVVTVSSCDSSGRKASAPERMKISISVLDAEKHGKDAAAKFLSDKFNVDFEYIPISWNDWNEKVRIWIVSSDAPDVIWWDLQQQNYSEFMQYVNQEALKPFPLDTKKYPNMQAALDKLKSDEYFTVNGKLYAWPVSRGEEHTGNIITQLFVYRKDWAEKLGLAKPDDIYTWEEAKAMAKAFMDNDAMGKGGHKTLGMGGVGFALPLCAGLVQNYPLWEDYFVKDGRYVWGASQPEMIAALKDAKQMFDSGIMWRDSIMAQSADSRNKYISGEMGLYYDGISPRTLDTLYKDIEVAQPGVDPVKAAAPMYVLNKNGKLPLLESPDYWSVTLLTQSISDEKIEKVMEIWDYLCSDESYDLISKGVKGIDWDEADGKVKLLQNDENQQNYLLKGFVRSVASYDLENPLFSETARNTTAQVIKNQLEMDSEIKKFNYDTNFFDAPFKNKNDNFRNQAMDKMKELLITSTDIEKDWKVWCASVQADVDKILAELDAGLLNKSSN